MSTVNEHLDTFLGREYEAGFITDIESVVIPKGLNEDTIRLISAKKKEPEFMLEWRLAAYRQWLEMTPPTWSVVEYDPIDFQDISYYAAPKSKEDGPKGLVVFVPEFSPTTESLVWPLNDWNLFEGFALEAVLAPV